MVLVPLYIHFMGIEAYGLVGFFAVLQAVLAFLDFGLSIALNREMARFSILSNTERDMRDLVRTLEIIYWLVAVIIGITILIFAPLVANKWVQAKELPLSVVQQAVMMMGFIIVFQWPASLYSGGLLGLQRQVMVNVVTVISATLRGFGVVLVLWLIAPTIQAFFAWQTLISAGTTLALGVILWRSLPHSSCPPRFNLRLLKAIGRFAVGTTGLTLQAVISSQQDKIILSKFIPLDSFGYYSLSASIAQNLGRLITPITTAVFPKFTQLHEQHDQSGLARLYHQSCQLLAVLIFPAAMTLAFFSPEVLYLWTRNPDIVQRSHLFLTLLSVGAALNIVMYIPSILQTAEGWLSLTLRANMIGLLCMIPLTVLLTRWYGAVGAAYSWISVNVANILIVPHFIHRRLLNAEKHKWYLYDVGFPLAAAVITALVFRIFLLPSLSAWGLFFFVGCAYVVILFMTALCARDILVLLRTRIAVALT